MKTLLTYALSGSLSLVGAMNTYQQGKDITINAYDDLKYRTHVFLNPETIYIESSKASKETYKNMMSLTAKEYHVSDKLVHAVALTESRLDPEVTSQVGARGIMQVMPFNASKCGIDKQDLYNAQKNIRCGIQILAKNLSVSRNTADALCLYNSGKKCSASSPQETKEYLVRVLNNLNLS